MRGGCVHRGDHTEILAQHIMWSTFKREPPFRAYNRECEQLEDYILGASAEGAG